MNEFIPNKMFFKIGDVANIADIEPHVLRYWESEFKNLKPQKDSNGQRVYRRKDVETVLKIKKLLYTDRYSIEGARKILKRRENVTAKQDVIMADLSYIKNELTKIFNILGGNPGDKSS